MLVLNRTKGEVIVIDSGARQTRVVVLNVRANGKVVLGIDAPKEVPVHRLEVFEAIEAQRPNAPCCRDGCPRCTHEARPEWNVTITPADDVAPPSPALFDGPNS